MAVPPSRRDRSVRFSLHLTDIHTTLLVGNRGKWIIFLGLPLVEYGGSPSDPGPNWQWPRRGTGKESWHCGRPQVTANGYGLHRRGGVLRPLLVIVLAGSGCASDKLYRVRLACGATAAGGPRGPNRADARTAMILGLARFPAPH